MQDREFILSKNQSASSSKMNNFQRIRELPRRQQSLLSLTLLERMKPNYDLFVMVTEFPQPYVLENMLQSLWDRVLVKGAKVNLSSMENKVEELTPDEHDFDMYGVYPAIYFNTGLLTYISGEASEDDFDAVAVAKISQGCIVHLIEYQAGEEELDNNMIREHELMQQETEFLSDLIQWLETVKLKGADATSIRQQALQKAFADGVTNIGIEVE